jgi:hypothetical protein
MKKLHFLVLGIILLALTAACGKPSGSPGAVPTVSNQEQASLGKEETPSPSALVPAVPGGEASASPKETASPLVLNLEDLLSAADATSLVGQAVTASFDAAAVSETGETWGSYTYDLPQEGIDVKDTILASACIVQNGLISPSELEKGHDAKWAYESFKKALPEKIVDLPGLGGKAFYVKDNSEVHVLFQDYYILLAFVKDCTDLEATLALNKSIAAFIIDNISLSDVSLTSPD